MKRPRLRRPRNAARRRPRARGHKRAAAAAALTRASATAARAPGNALRLLPPRARLAAVGIALTLAVLGGLYFFVLRDSSLVSVEQVRVTGVSGGNAHRIVARLTNAARDMTTLHVDADALRSAVAAFPEVRGLKAEADFPHGLRIVVAERVPVAALTAGSRHVAVASDGTLLPGERTRALPAIPVRALPTGERLTNAAGLRAVAILAAAPASMRARVDGLAKGKGGLRATLRGGGTVVFGAPTLLAAKWLAAAAVLRDPSAKGARYLDVRIPRRPVAGGLPPQIDPTTGERIDPSTGQTPDGTTDPLAADTGDTATDPTADGTADGTTGDGTTDAASDGSQSEDGQFAGASP
jgi:cell division protein FtsQ